MTCRITVDDGVAAPVVLENDPSLIISHEPLEEGGSILRFLDGSAAKQDRWLKYRRDISGERKLPTGLQALSITGPLTVTVETGLGTSIYTCLSARGASEEWDLYGGSVGWSMDLEDA